MGSVAKLFETVSELFLFVEGMNLFEIDIQKSEFRLRTDRIPTCGELAASPLVVEAKSIRGKFVLAIMAKVAQRHLCSNNCEFISLSTLSEELQESVGVYTEYSRRLPDKPDVTLFGAWSGGINIVGKTFCVRTARRQSSEVCNLFSPKQAIRSQGSASNPEGMKIAIDFKALGIELSASEIIVSSPPPRKTSLPRKDRSKQAQSKPELNNSLISPWEILSCIMAHMSRDDVVQYLREDGISRKSSERAVDGLARLALEIKSGGHK